MSGANRTLQLLSRWVMVFPFVWRYRRAVADGDALHSNYILFKYEYGPFRFGLVAPKTHQQEPEQSGSK